MQLDTVIFDMDGLLIDSEPLWKLAADEVFKQYGISFTTEQYNSTTGLRTKEFVEYWFEYFKLNMAEVPKAAKAIIDLVIEMVKKQGVLMPGVQHIFQFFSKHHFKIGLATSSPRSLIDVVVNIAGISPFLQAIASAEEMEYGKPHPQVYLNCAQQLNSHPTSCICFEDSFNGMIAAKAARMKCVVVPHGSLQKEERWAAADLKLSSLLNFGDLHLAGLHP